MTGIQSGAASGFALSSLVLLAIAFAFGGWTWTLLCLLGVASQIRAQPGSLRLLAAIGPSLLWLALSRWSGNRELFFPFTMYLAAHAALPVAGRTLYRAATGGALIVTVFAFIRILQMATTRILVVELVVAAAILALAIIVCRTGPQNTAARTAIAALASLMAYAGLAI